MICCFINGKVAYPSASNDIKVTLLNPFVKDGDEKTMEVIFPMDIAENREIFGSLNRLDTSFAMDDFESCRLVADNIEVISGKGTVTQVTEVEVKLQILAGRSYLRYKASFDNVYLDQIDYGSVANKYQRLINGRGRLLSELNFVSELNAKGFIGEAGKYAFLPAHDESNDYWANSLCYMKSDADVELGVTLIRPAVQPNLMFVLRKVLEYLGYDVTRNDYDKAPWNNLYVCSARSSLSLGGALPHWSCYKFLDEFRKLFNAVFMFDELEKSVSIVQFDESDGTGTEYVTPLEGFSSGYEEEGLEYLAASNLEYSLSDCERSIDVVPEDVRNSFNVIEYDSYYEMERAFTAMSVKEKMTTLMKLQVGWFYGRSVLNDDGVVTGYKIAECGWFSPLVRKSGASVINLNIVPVAMSWGESRCFTACAGDGNNGAFVIPVLELSFDCLIANITCDNQTSDKLFLDSESSTEEYISVEDVLENGESIPDKSDDDSLLEIFFASGMRFKPLSHDFVAKYSEFNLSDPDTILQPVAYTECRHTDDIQLPRNSLSLFPAADYIHVGNFHNKGVRIRRNVNGNNEVKVEFIFDGKPDPRKIYIFKNKKFLCSHIEMAVSHDGINPVKTGYFYEIES